MAIDDMMRELKDLARVVDEATKKIGDLKAPVIFR